MTASTLANRPLAHGAVRAEAAALADQVHDGRMRAVTVVLDDGSEVELPATLARFVMDTVHAIAAGGTVTVDTVSEEVTTTSAAQLLGVSRPTLMKMIGRNELPSFRVGTHTRLRREDVLALRERRLEQQAAAVQALRQAGEAFD